MGETTMDETAQAVPEAFPIPAYVTIDEVRDEQGRKLRPFAIVMGGVLLGMLDTPEKIARLHKPDMLHLRHADLTSGPTFDRTELQQVDTASDGMPIYGHRVVEKGGVTDALARVTCDLVVGYSPETIADHVRDLVLTAFMKVPPYLHGQALDQPVPAEG